MQTEKPRLVLEVQDLDRSIAFYQGQLGWPEEWRDARQGRPA